MIETFEVPAFSASQETEDQESGFRNVHVYLPPGYDQEPDRHYPVLYMQDGQNIFSTEQAAFVSWDVDITADRLIGSGLIEPIIIVGVANTMWRDDEYTPTFDRSEGSGGGADLYLDYLTEEIIPLIEGNYRTLPDRADRAVCGSSLGGLLALYAAMRHTETFGQVAAISPSLWWDRKVIFDLASQWDMEEMDTRIWIDMGYHEEDEEDQEDSENGAQDDEASDDLDYSVEPDDLDQDFEDSDDDEDDEEDEDEEDDDEPESDPVEDARDFCDLLIDRGFVEGDDLLYYEDAWGYHDEVSWGIRMEKVLMFLFGLSD